MGNLPVNRAIVDRIHKYAEEASRFEGRSSSQATNIAQPQYEENLDKAILRLRRQVKEHTIALEKLRASQLSPLDLNPSPEPGRRLAQINLNMAAYQRLLEADTSLEPIYSPLPSIIALHQTHMLIGQMKTNSWNFKTDISANRKSLGLEETSLHEARSITAAMGQRLERLRAQASLEKGKLPSRRTHEQIEQQHQLKLKIAADNAVLESELTSFINDRLAAMIAAEDLGGPTAGDTSNIEEDMLELGFTNQGKTRKVKASRSTANTLEWNRPGGHPGPGNNTPAERRRETAASEMQSLVEKLLGAYDNGNTYVELSKDSAASRFMVRAKVAQFHSRDARRLRLLDFAREMGD